MAVNNSLVAKSKAQQRLGLTAYLTQDAIRANINQVVGGKDGQKFIASVVSAVQANPQLQECTNQSILSAALIGASLNLTPSPQLGQYYFVPYNNTKLDPATGKKINIKEAQFQLGYKGYIQLAIRSGYYKKLNVISIKQGELVKFDPMNEEIEVNLIEDDGIRENTPTIGYYAFFEYMNGFRKAIYWSKAKMEAHALRYSPGYKAKKGYTFWEKSFDDMAYKTMLRHLISRWGILSTDLQTAFESDFAEQTEEPTSYVETETVPEAIPEVTPEPEPEKKTTKKKIETPKDEPKATETPEDAAAALFG